MPRRRDLTVTMVKLTPYNKAIDLLSRREHSQQELRRKLARFNFDEAELEQALADLIAAGYLSDERFTESYIRLRAQRGYGPLRIAGELQQRGVATRLIDKYLQPHSEQWVQYAQDTFSKKYPEGLATDYLERMKQLKFMQYRGFSDYLTKSGVE